ncbi:hypothetical protein Pfo_010534 [Paulownia fortunei]|nr:hypothetical protein Pfo_010534 [Paulownia fortunei]
MFCKLCLYTCMHVYFLNFYVLKFLYDVILWQTTLLNHILTSQHGKRIAVIENEFGEVDIDSSLVASHSSSNEEDIIMVNNGCLCCTVRGDLVKMLLELVKKKRDKFDHIVIETTGLAKPGPVIETFCSDELLSRHVKLDGVVTLVDSVNAIRHLNEVKPRFVVNEAVEQIAYADRIILNKIDLVNEAEVEALTKRIKLINGLAQIKLAKYGVVDMDFVLGVGGYDLDRIESEVKSDDSHCSHQHETGHEHHKGHHHDHIHDSAVSSVSIVSEGTLDLDYFDDWLERLVEEKGDDLCRMKGILSVGDSEQRYVFQGLIYGGFRIEREKNICSQRTIVRRFSRNLGFVISAAAGESGSSVEFDVPFPSDYTELLKQAKEATELALKNNRQLMEIEFPTAGLESVPGDGEGGIEMTGSMQLIREFCDLVISPEKTTRTRIFFPEANEVTFARKSAFGGSSLKLDYLTKPSFFEDFGFVSKVKMADRVKPEDELFLVAYPYFNVNEMLVVEELYKEAVVNTTRKLIIFNGELDRIRSGCILSPYFIHSLHNHI